MALPEKVLRKKAKKFELKESERSRIIPERVKPLEELLNDVYLILRPKPADYDKRRDLIRVFNEIAKQIYGNSDHTPVVEAFGSFSMDLFTAKSDLDLSVNFGSKAAGFPRGKKIKEIRKFANKFYALERNGHVSGINPVTTAKVPIVKVVDRGTGIECDVSIENRDGILKSKLVHIISSIDERFQKLSFLMKGWANVQGINSSKDGTLNSLSIILLVAFHLQTRDPPILPRFSDLFKDGTDPASVVKIVQRFSNFGKRNLESLADLFVSFLIKLNSVERLWSKGLCASTYQGSWISKTWGSKVGCMSVEDFTELSQNVARAVGASEVKKIYRCIQLSIQHIFAFVRGLIQGQRLRDLLFGHDGPPTLSGSQVVNLVRNPSVLCILPESGHTKMVQPMQVWETKPQTMLSDSIPTKRMRPVEEMPTRIWGGRPIEGWESVPRSTWGATPTQAWGEAPREGRERLHAGSWGTTPAEAWRGRQMEWWGRAAGSSGAKTSEIWRRTSQPTGGWSAWQEDADIDFTWSKRARYTSREGELQAGGEGSSNVNGSYLPVACYSSVPSSGLGNQVSYAVPHPNFAPSTYPSALDHAAGEAGHVIPRTFVRR